jgi:hypothetical protein
MKLRELATLDLRIPTDNVELAGKSLLVHSDGDCFLYTQRGKRLARLPDTWAEALDDTCVIVHRPGVYVGKRYEWDIELWDATKGKRLVRLARCHPDDNLGKLGLAGERIFGLRTRKRTSLVELDRRGTELSALTLATDLTVFHLAVSPDRTKAVWLYFTGKGGVVDLVTRKQAPLLGGALRIGRQHDKGISELAFDRSGHFALAVSAAMSKVTIWDLTTRKVVAGPWRSAAAYGACFVGDRVCWWSSDLPPASAPIAGGTVTALPTKLRGDRALGDERHVVCVGPTGLELWDVAAAKRRARHAAKREIRLFDARSDLLVIGDNTGKLTLLELA